MRKPLNSRLNTCHQRRLFLKMGVGAAAATLAMPAAYANIAKQPERKLSLYNLHTGEQLRTTYWVAGEYQRSELSAIYHLLRDHRTDEVAELDDKLIDLMNLLHLQMAAKQPFHIISGYRSPKTNENLRKTSSGVARKSYHTKGQAVDLRLPDRDLADLHRTALKMEAGGVGYYPKSNFIHIDVGPVRQWQG